MSNIIYHIFKIKKKNYVKHKTLKKKLNSLYHRVLLVNGTKDKINLKSKFNLK